MKGTKKIHLEIIRIVALICIIFNHTGGRGNNSYLFTNGKITFVLTLSMDILCKIGVPLFLMVSGALLFAKEENWQQIYRKRIWRIVKVIILFTIIRYFYECIYLKKFYFSIWKLIKAILAGNLFVPYWFLYTYLSILLVLPFLKKMVKNLDEKEMRMLVILILFFHAFLPVISAIFKMNVEIFWGIGITCCYCILGYYLEHVISENMYTKKNIILAIIVTMGSIVLSYWVVTKERASLGVIAEEYTSVLSILIAFCVFFIIKALWGSNMEKRGNAVINKCIEVVGSCSFGIYLIEDYLRNGLSFICDNLAPYITTLPACMVWLAMVVIVGVAIVSFLKNIPGMKEIL